MSGTDKSSPSTLTYLKIAAYVLIAAFFVWFLWGTDWSLLNDLQVTWPLLVAALVVGLLFRFIGVGVWRFVLTSLGAKQLPSFGVLAQVYSRAWMGRYIPGKVMWIGGKVLFASEYGISKSRLTVASLVEAGAQVLGGAILALTWSVIDGRLFDTMPTIQAVAIASIVILGAALSPPVFNRIMALVFRLAKRGTSTPVGWPTLGRTLGLHSVASIVGGAGNAVFAMALVPELQMSDFLYLMAAFGLAGVAGMVAIFAPAGLGVREGVLLVMLAVVMSPAAAIIVAVVGRLFGALMDVMFWSLSEIYSRANTSN